MMSLRAAWVSGVASTIPPSAAVFLAAYSWILFTKRDWMGSAWAAAAMAGVLVLRQRLARETEAARRDIILILLRSVIRGLGAQRAPGKGDGGSAQGHHPYSLKKCYQGCWCSESAWQGRRRQRAGTSSLFS